MGGFFGVVSASNCVREVFYGTDYHSHLGTRRGGMAVQTEDGSIRRRIHDITNSQFKTKLEPILSECSGKCAIGIISDVEDQPLLVSSRLGTYAIVTVGKIENIRELAEEYAFSADEVTGTVTEETIRELDQEYARWWTRIVNEGVIGDVPEWSSEELENAVAENMDIEAAGESAAERAGEAAGAIEKTIHETLMPVRKAPIMSSSWVTWAIRRNALPGCTMK